MADVLDVNVGFAGVADVKLLPETVIKIQERFDIPLCLDSPNPKACLVTLETIRLVHQKLGPNITQGASNISFGLPDRETLNVVFMVLAILKGLTCPIANPEKITAAVRATDLVLDRDNYAIRFIDYFQSHK